MSYFQSEYIIIIIIGTITMFSFGTTTPLIATYVKQEFTSSILLVGFAVSGYFLLRAFSELPFGVLSDRIGLRKPLIFGRILTIVAPLICWVTKEIYHLVVARAFWGVGDAAFFCTSTVYVANLFSKRERGKAIGILTAVEWIGNLLGQSLGGLIATLIGIRATFLISTFLGVLTLILVTLIKAHKDLSNVSFQTQIWPSWKMMRSAINFPVLIACFLNFFFNFRNNGIISELFPLYIKEEIGASLTEYGFLIAVSTGSSVIGMSLGGFMSDRFGSKKVIALGFGIGVAATYLLAVVNKVPFFFPVMVMNGLFFGIVYSVTPALIVESVPNNVRGTAIGIYRTFFDLGGLVGPITMSAIAEIVDLPYGYIVAFYVTTIILFVNLLAIKFLKKIKY